MHYQIAEGVLNKQQSILGKDEQGRQQKGGRKSRILLKDRQTSCRQKYFRENQTTVCDWQKGLHPEWHRWKFWLRLVTKNSVASQTLTIRNLSVALHDQPSFTIIIAATTCRFILQNIMRMHVTGCTPLWLTQNAAARMLSHNTPLLCTLHRYCRLLKFIQDTGAVNNSGPSSIQDLVKANTAAWYSITTIRHSYHSINATPSAVLVEWWWNELPTDITTHLFCLSTHLKTQLFRQH